MGSLFGGGSDVKVQPTRRKDVILPFTAGGLRTDLSGGRLRVSQTGGGGGLQLPPGARVQNGRVVKDVSTGGSAGRGGSAGVSGSGIFSGSRELPGQVHPLAVQRANELGINIPGGGTQTIDLGPVENFRGGGVGNRGRLVGQLSETFGSQADELAGLQSLVEPGFSDLRQSGLNQIEDRARRATGNLRENLSRRRVLGSSFGQDALSRLESEFAREEADFTARSLLQELDATRQLIGDKTAARAQQFQTRLNELNLQAEIASNLASGATNALSANARTQAQLAAKEAQGRGSFFGNLIGTAAPIVGGLFGGPAGAAAGSTVGGIDPSGFLGAAELLG